MADYRQLGYDIYFRRALPTNPNQQSAVSYDSMQEGSQTTEYAIQDGAVTSRKIKSINAELIETSTLNARVDVGSGSGFVRIDGPKNRFLLNDGITNRILIGAVSNDGT